MKPIIIKKDQTLKIKLDWDITNWCDVTVAYAASWTNWVVEDNVMLSVADTDEHDLLSNSSDDNYVVADVVIHNKDDWSVTATLELYDGTNTFIFGKATVEWQKNIWLESFDSTKTLQDEKVKTDVNDPSSWYLSDKVDWTTIVADTDNHIILVWDWWISESKIADWAVTTTKIWDWAVTAVKLWDDIDHTKITDFDEAAQDAVWWILTDTNSIDFTYDDDNNSITAYVKIQNTTTVNLSVDDSWLKADVIDNTTTQKIVVDKWWSNVWTRKEINFIEWDNVTIDITDDSDNDKIDITISASWWSWSWLSVTPVTRYDWELTEWTFDEIQAPADLTLNSIKATLENLPQGSDTDNDDTTLEIEYTTDGGDNWDSLASITFSWDDTTTNGIDIKDADPSTNSIDENTRIRFRISQTADQYAGWNLKIYFK